MYSSVSSVLLILNLTSRIDSLHSCENNCLALSGGIIEPLETAQRDGNGEPKTKNEVAFTCLIGSGPEVEKWSKTLSG